jgi:hypothetical protein
VALFGLRGGRGEEILSSCSFLPNYKYTEI